MTVQIFNKIIVVFRLPKQLLTYVPLQFFDLIGAKNPKYQSLTKKTNYDFEINTSLCPYKKKKFTN